MLVHFYFTVFWLIRNQLFLYIHHLTLKYFRALNLCILYLYYVNIQLQVIFMLHKIKLFPLHIKFIILIVIKIHISYIEIILILQKI